jgi:hypothetical protein
MSTGFADVSGVVPTVLVGHEQEPVTASFSYRVDDPYAVYAAFTVEGVQIEWSFARDLLLDGMSFATGVGDVLVAPVDGGVQLTLRSPDGVARLLCDRTSLAWFVDQIYAAVPAGDESAHLALDELLAALTS